MGEKIATEVTESTEIETKPSVYFVFSVAKTLYPAIYTLLHRLPECDSAGLLTHIGCRNTT